VVPLARAWRWQRLLDDGVYASVSDIGDIEDISRSYVSRILRLSLLAPDITQAILAGNGWPVPDAAEAGAAAAGELGRAAEDPWLIALDKRHPPRMSAGAVCASQRNSLRLNMWGDISGWHQPVGCSSAWPTSE
jgi:hypothetical protein